MQDDIEPVDIGTSESSVHRTDGHITYSGDEWPCSRIDRYTARFWLQIVDHDFEVLSDLGRVLEGGHAVDHELKETGLKYLVGVRYGRGKDVEGVIVCDPIADWCKERCLIPGQPFEIELYCRPYVSHGPEGDEGDLDTSWEIISRHSSNPKDVVKFFAESQQHLEAWEAQIRRETGESTAMIAARSDLLYRRHDWYWSDGSFYDDMSPPNAVRVSIHSAYGKKNENGRTVYRPHAALSYGEDDNGDQIKAAEIALAKLRDGYPSFARVMLADIPVLSYHPQTDALNPFKK